jgi:hypothetical protein
LSANTLAAVSEINAALQANSPYYGTFDAMGITTNCGAMVNFTVDQANDDLRFTYKLDDLLLAIDRPIYMIECETSYELYLDPLKTCGQGAFGIIPTDSLVILHMEDGNDFLSLTSKKSACMDSASE